MKGFLKKQLPRCKEAFKFHDTTSGSNNEERILAELDQDDEEKLEKVMNLQSIHLINSLKKRIVNLIRRKKRNNNSC